MAHLGLSRIVRAAAFVAVSASLTAGQTYGATAYDGRWAVTVTPEGGECEGMYVLPVEVAGGRVTYIGRAAITAEGGIGPDGTVRVAFVIEGDRLDAKGTMNTAHFGAGSWVSPTEDCRGTWIARKR